jgi:hypothetical protein
VGVRPKQLASVDVYGPLDAGTRPIVGNNILDGEPSTRQAQKRQAGVISPGLVFGLALIGIIVLWWTTCKAQEAIDRSYIPRWHHLDTNSAMPNWRVWEGLILNIGMYKDFDFGANASVKFIETESYSLSGYRCARSHRDTGRVCQICWFQIVRDGSRGHLG